MKFTIISITTIILLLLLFYVLCTTQVIEGRKSVITSFGKPIRVIEQAGLHLKWPYPFHKVQKIDCRLTLLQPKPSEFLTADKKNLILENCICYRITDPITYLKTVRDRDGLELRLADLMSSHTGTLLGIRELSALVNVDSSKMELRSLNSELTKLLCEDSRELGVEVEKVFIKRIMLPYQNLLAVYDRMRAERDRVAKQYLAEGEEKAIEIRADADKIARTIIAEAEMQAEIIKGKADAEAMMTYGMAYKQNQDFYKFLRALEAYEKLFNQKTVIVLDNDSPMLKTLFSGGKVED